MEESAHQVCVEAIEFDQFIVGPQLFYLPLAHHSDSIGIADGAEAMRDDDCCLRLRLCTQ